MAVVKNPFMSFDAHGTFGKVLTVRRQYGKHIMQRYPRYVYTCSALQLVERDRMRRLQVIASWYKAQKKMELITEIRPEVILDPSGPTFYFDMSCGGGTSIGYSLGVPALTWTFEYGKDREVKTLWYGGLLK